MKTRICSFVVVVISLLMLSCQEKDMYGYWYVRMVMINGNDISQLVYGELRIQENRRVSLPVIYLQEYSNINGQKFGYIEELEEGWVKISSPNPVFHGEFSIDISKQDGVHYLTLKNDSTELIAQWSGFK